MPRRPSKLAPPEPEPLNPEALVVQVRTLLAEAQALSTRLAALNEVATVMQARLDAESVLQTLARQARWLLDFHICSVALCTEEGYRIQVLRGPNYVADTQSHPIGNEAIGRALQFRHALLLPQLTPQDQGPPEMQSGVVVPLASGGELIGTLNFYSRTPQRYTQDDLRIVSALSSQVAAMLQNVRLFADVDQARNELSTVLESIGDAVLVIDTSGHIRLVNSAARNLIRLHDSDLIGRRALWLQRLSLNNRPILPVASLRPIVAAWKQRHQGVGSGMLQISDGRSFEWTLAPLAPGGVLAGGILTLRDVSARSALEQLRDDMIQMLVHDLRTPLAAMIMGLELIDYADSTGNREMRTEMLDRARSSANKLLSQVNLILDVRKLEAGRVELNLLPSSIVSLIEHALIPMAPLADRSNLLIRTHITPGLPAIQVDASLVQRVIENLLGNAIKFTPSGGTILVGAALVADQPQLEIWVEDTGPGIPEALRQTIFEKYAQAPGEAQRKGTGLGLAFCKLVAEAHMGSVGVDGTEAGGSRFWIRFPLSQ